MERDAKCEAVGTEGKDGWQRRFINPMSDFGFKRIFSDERVMRAFLTDLLKPATPIAAITHLDKEMLGEFQEERGVTYDLRCRTEDGSEFLVEMQSKGQKFFSDRIIYYLSRSFSSQRPKGKTQETDASSGVVRNKEWDYHLTPVYGIFFLNFHLEGFKRRSVRTIQLKVRETGEVFSEKLKAYTLELSGYNGKNPRACRTKIDYWLYNISNMQDMTELAFTKSQPAFKVISDIAELAKLTPEEREQYEYAEDQYFTFCAQLDYQYEQGMKAERKRFEKERQSFEKQSKEFEQQSKEFEQQTQKFEQNKIQTVKALKESGVSLDVIAKCTGLSVEEIAQI